jgi:hypothetical protein
MFQENLYRINLRGPWGFVVGTAGITASRKFHRPPAGERFFLAVQHANGFPVQSLSLNDVELCRIEESSTESVHRVEVTDILASFNSIAIHWSHWPKEIADQVEPAALSSQSQTQMEIRYTPSPTHPLHIDSWLEIEE